MNENGLQDKNQFQESPQLDQIIDQFNASEELKPLITIVQQSTNLGAQLASTLTLSDKMIELKDVIIKLKYEITKIKIEDLVKIGLHLKDSSKYPGVKVLIKPDTLVKKISNMHPILFNGLGNVSYEVVKGENSEYDINLNGFLKKIETIPNEVVLALIESRLILETRSGYVSINHLSYLFHKATLLGYTKLFHKTQEKIGLKLQTISDRKEINTAQINNSNNYSEDLEKMLSDRKVTIISSIETIDELHKICKKPYGWNEKYRSEQEKTIYNREVKLLPSLLRDISDLSELYDILMMVKSQEIYKSIHHKAKEIISVKSWNDAEDLLLTLFFTKKLDDLDEKFGGLENLYEFAVGKIKQDLPEINSINSLVSLWMELDDLEGSEWQYDYYWGVKATPIIEELILQQINTENIANLSSHQIQAIIKIYFNLENNEVRSQYAKILSDYFLSEHLSK